MKLLDLTLATPAENLALDEALLVEAEESGRPGEALRLWESPQLAVVVGRSSRVAEEVDLAECRRRGIPVLRRPSGGAAVVIGPGCLMYAVVLSYKLRPQLRAIDAAHRFVLGAIAEAAERHLPGVTLQGVSDLAIAGDPPRKFSGNSLRCKQSHLLYHGTMLYDFPLDRISTCLRAPPRAPDYRGGRDHRGFVANVPLERSRLREAIVEAFNATESLAEWPRTTTVELVAQRYSRDAWSFLR
jgi:lipoate-protein ligase A